MPSDGSPEGSFAGGGRFESLAFEVSSGLRLGGELEGWTSLASGLCRSVSMCCSAYCSSDVTLKTLNVLCYEFISL